MSLVVPLEEIFNNEGLLCKAEHWERVELSLAVSIMNGFPLKSTAFNSEKGFPVIRIRDLKFNKIQTYYSQDFPKEYVVSNGDLLVGMDGDFICYEWTGGNAVLNQRVCKLVTDENYLLKRFLFYGINGYLNAIQKATSSVTVGHLSSIDAGKIPFPLPPLSEQHRIVAKLDAIMQKVESTQNRFKKIPNILILRKEIIKLAFTGQLSKIWRNKNPKVNSKDLLKTLISITDKKGKIAPTYFIPENGLPIIPDSWAWASFGQIGKVVTGKTPSKKNPKFWSGTIPFVMPSDLNKSENCLSLTEISLTDEMVTKEGFQSVQNITEDAVLVCCIGTLGRVAITKKSISFSQQLNAIIPHLKIDLEFVGYYCYIIKELLEELWTRETYMPIVNKSQFSTIPIPIPPYEEQLFIVSELKNKLLAQIKLEARYTKAKTMLDKLPQSILAKAFRGELVAQDPNDEPASVLLERIKAEKEKLAAEKKTLRQTQGKGKKTNEYSIEETPEKIAAENKIKYKKAK